MMATPHAANTHGYSSAEQPEARAKTQAVGHPFGQIFRVVRVAMRPIVHSKQGESDAVIRQGQRHHTALGPAAGRDRIDITDGDGHPANAKHLGKTRDRWRSSSTTNRLK
jgi:hypothetical protein